MIFKTGEITGGALACEIIRPVLGGTMAEIYEARLRNTNHLVIVKGVEKNVSKIESEALKREAEIMKGIRLDTIPEFYEYVEDEYKAYIVMSKHTGENVEKLAGKQWLREGEIKHIGLSMSRTLHYLHKKGLVYGDMKPANILFDCKTKRACLLDYGTALQVGERLLPTFFRGTLGYAAPECWNVTAGQITGLVDVFALGATLYHLLEGKNPRYQFGRFYLTDMQKKNRWQSVLDKCCALNPEYRYQSAEELYYAISEIKI